MEPQFRRTTGAKPEVKRSWERGPTATGSLPNKAPNGLDGPPSTAECSHARDSTTP